MPYQNKIYNLLQLSKYSLILIILFSFLSLYNYAQDDYAFEHIEDNFDEEHVSIYRTSYDNITSQEKLKFQDTAYEYVMGIQDSGVEALLDSDGAQRYNGFVEDAKGLAESMTDSIATAFGTVGPYLKSLGGLLYRFLGNIDASVLTEILGIVKYLMLAMGYMMLGKAFLQAVKYAFFSTAGLPWAFLYPTWGFLSTPNMFNMGAQLIRGGMSIFANTWGSVARTSWLFFTMMNTTNNLRYHYSDIDELRLHGKVEEKLLDMHQRLKAVQDAIPTIREDIPNMPSFVVKSFVDRANQCRIMHKALSYGINDSLFHFWYSTTDSTQYSYMPEEPGEGTVLLSGTEDHEDNQGDNQNDQDFVYDEVADNDIDANAQQIVATSRTEAGEYTPTAGEILGLSADYEEHGDFNEDEDVSALEDDDQMYGTEEYTSRSTYLDFYGPSDYYSGAIGADSNASYPSNFILYQEFMTESATLARDIDDLYYDMHKQSNLWKFFLYGEDAITELTFPDWYDRDFDFQAPEESQW